MTGWTLRPGARRTVRARLTLLWLGLFLAFGTALLAATYLLMVSGVGGTLLGPSRPPVVGSPASPVGPLPEVVPPPSPADEVRRQRAEQHREFLVDAGAALALTATAAAGLGWLAAGRLLRPLRTMTESVRQISATSLDRRLALPGPPDELTRLGDTFDDLLARLEASFRSQRRFVAHASHELRTPLARQRVVVQVALDDPDATVASLRAAHERALAANRQQERIIEALLALARGEAGPDVRRPVDLATVAQGVLVGAVALADELDVTLSSALAPAATGGDPRLIERLVTNLVENALRHNAPGGRARVTTGTEAGHAVLHVTNTGPPVPVEVLERLFEPFQRLDPTRAGDGHGLGLGLSIVRAVAATHGATVTATPRDGGGLDVRVAFPAGVRAV